VGWSGNVRKFGGKTTTRRGKKKRYIFRKIQPIPERQLLPEKILEGGGSVSYKEQLETARKYERMNFFGPKGMGNRKKIGREEGP